MKKIITFLLLLLNLSALSQEIHNKKNLSEYEFDGIKKSQVENPYFPVINPALGDTFSFSDYDYWGNAIIKDKVVYYNGPHIVSLIRDSQGPFRYLSYFQIDSGFYNSSYPFDSSLTSFPQIDVVLTGINDGVIGISDGKSKLAIIQNNTVSIKQTPADNEQSFIFSGENIFLFTEGYIYKSIDGGDNYSAIDSISSFTIYTTSIGSDVDMFKSPNQQYIGILTTAAGDGEVYSGVPVSNADNVWLIYSTDSGNSWDGKSIGFDGYINSVQNYHTPNFAPLFENFGQVSGTAGNDGVFHVVANGYGVVFNDEIGSNIVGSSFPVLYWNSETELWKSISNPEIDNIQEIEDYYPTNSLGQAYPSISINDTGNVLFVVWTGPQLTETGELDIADNGSGVQYYWRDLYYSISYNGGETWSYKGVLTGKQNISEAYGTSAQHIFADNTENIVHMTYLEDLTTGVGPFDAVLTENPLIYKTVLVPPAPLSVGNGNMLADYILYQNYPNPFNPVTNISFSLSKIARVKLEVYNVVGEKISSLWNKELEKGFHSIELNAANFSSGVYFYKIITEDFSQTKKMILLK